MHAWISDYVISLTVNMLNNMRYEGSLDEAKGTKHGGKTRADT